MTYKEIMADRTIPEACKRTLRAARGGRSRKAAVKAFCDACMGYEAVSEAVRNCAAPDCPLFPYRPYQMKG